MSDNRLKRPPFILAHPADSAGCGHHRVIRPVEILTRSGLAFGRFEAKVLPDDMLKPLAPDIVVWQRQMEDYQVENMRRYRRALPDAIFVYEIDDALDQVPESSYHRPFIPRSVNEKMARAIALCDVLSVSTRALGRHLEGVLRDQLDKDAKGPDISVVPNMLGRDDFQAAAAARLRARRPHQKPRIGWGGGISHTGDLALIKRAMEVLGDKVQWVFLGMRPEGIDAPVEFHQGVPPRQYLAKLAALNLDLMVAPIEDNFFNQCKSNLRLIEGGACGYPVIASPVEPYVDGNPPVFAYAKSMDDWVSAIERFIALPPNQQAEHGNRLKSWAERHYCFDDKAEERLQRWLPPSRKPFRPRRNTSAAGLMIVCPSPTPEQAELGTVHTSLARACDSTCDVLYVAPGTKVTQDQIDRLKARLRGNIASVSALSNDGGLCGFPKQFQFCPMNAEHGEKLDAMVAELYDDAEALIPFPSGPLTLLSRRAIDAFGAPEACDPGAEQETLIEWGLMVSTRNLRCAVAPDVFASVTQAKPDRRLQEAVRRGQLRYPPPQGISADPLAKIRSELELAFYREMFTIPMVTKGAGYAEWASYFDTPGMRDASMMRAKDDGLACQHEMGGKNIVHPKFAIVAHEQYLQVEPQTWPHSARIMHQTFREAIANAEDLGCDWLVFARDGSIIRSHALWMLAHRIRKNPGAVMIYSDHDFIKDGARRAHDFKPSIVDSDLLLGRDYITPFFAVRAGDVRKLFAVHIDETISELSLYRLALTVAWEITPKSIDHLPRVLAHLHGPDLDREKKATYAKVAVANHFLASRKERIKVGVHPRFPQYAAVTYLPPAPAPLVSIIIPTKDKVEMLQPCVDSLLKLTKYENFEVLIIDNGSTWQQHLEYMKEVQERDKRVRVLRWDHPFNWSALNNWAVDQAKGDYVLLLNDDTRIVEGGWLDEMVGCAARRGVGAVGARLIYPHDMVQHIGVVCAKGLTGHIHKGLPASQPGYNGIAVLSHESTAVTGACLMVWKDLFVEVGKLDEDLAHNFNDVAFCLELRRRGYRNVLAAGAVLQHLEGATRMNDPAKNQENLELIWAEGRILANKYPEPDPYWNENTVLLHHNNGAFVSGTNLDILNWPPAPWPWREGEDWKSERVLMIGDDGRATALEVREGNPVYSAAVVEGTKLKFVNPQIENSIPFDIRNPAAAEHAIKILGIERIVLRSILNAPVELLPFLRRLGVPIIYAPLTAESICPRLDMKVEGIPCGNDDVDRDRCAACVWEHSSFFGVVSIEGWREQWASLLGCAGVDLRDLDETLAGAVRRVYGHELYGTAASGAL